MENKELIDMLGRPRDPREGEKSVVRVGLDTPFWRWWQARLQKERDNAIISLTNVPISADNVYEIAALQVRLRLATELLNAPYDLLGIPGPVNPDRSPR